MLDPNPPFDAAAPQAPGDAAPGSDRPQPATKADDHDSPWKDAIEIFFRQAIELLAPALHKEIDWSVAPDFLDKELQAIAIPGKQGRRFVFRRLCRALDHGNAVPVIGDEGRTGWSIRIPAFRKRAEIIICRTGVRRGTESVFLDRLTEEFDAAVPVGDHAVPEDEPHAEKRHCLGVTFGDRPLKPGHRIPAIHRQAFAVPPGQAVIEHRRRYAAGAGQAL